MSDDYYDDDLYYNDDLDPLSETDEYGTDPDSDEHEDDNENLPSTIFYGFMTMIMGDSSDS